MTQERHDLLEIKPMSLYRLVKDVIVDHKPLIMSKHISLCLDDSDLFMFGDYEKLRIVIDNLLSNAVKYSPSGGNIHISIRKDKQHAVLDMIDAGPGIDHEDKQSVFEPFYQGSIAPDSPVKGSGLGLSIARDYVLAHHGHISILDDARPGAHFRVTLPIKSKDVM
jgi:two-component system sensor histidine kinase GlrK